MNSEYKSKVASKQRTFSALAVLMCVLTVTACSSEGIPGTAVNTADTGSDDNSDPSAEPASPLPGSDDTTSNDGAPSTNSADPSSTNDETFTIAPPVPDSAFDIFPSSPSDLTQRGTIYQQDGYADANVIRIDMRTETTPGICTLADDSGCTLADVIADTDRRDDLSVKIPAHFQSTDYPDDGSISNIEFSQRGGSTRQAAQKSFKIRVDDRDNLWRNERSLLLNKHPFEATRIRNKLAFDLMSQMPHLLSFRTQFVNLWIDDGQGPEDYGMFTHVEAPGGNYLDKRGLDRNDRLYKVGFFRFTDDDLLNVQVDAEGEPLNLDLFESSLEIESGSDHRPLVEMLEAMQDPQRSFDSVLDEYFNRNNVLLWMTVNLLMHQTDAVTHNFLLYNPQGSKTFYFLPWDYDGGFVLEAEPNPADMSNAGLQRRVFYGYARGINSDFHTRYYQLPGIHQQILEAADVIRENWMTDAQISERALLLESIVEPYITRSPDIDFNTSYSAFSVVGFAGHVAGNHEALQTRFGVPMPPELDKSTEFDEESNEWVFRWIPAYDVTGHSISYDLQVSTSTLFDADDIVYSVQGLPDAPEEVIHRVPATRFRTGDHFVRVIARASSDPQRYWQIPKNDDVISDGVTWYGMVQFNVP